VYQPHTTFFEIIKTAEMPVFTGVYGSLLLFYLSKSRVYHADRRIASGK